MSSSRTQIYLTDEQRRRIDRVARARGVTMAEVIREAVDLFVGDDSDPTSALQATFATVPDLVVPDRDEWARG